MTLLLDFALPESLPRLARHKAGDHSLCRPDSPGHGTCAKCGKTVQVSRSSAPPDRRRCRDCQRSSPKAAPAPRICALCEESYVPKPMHRPDQRWCSKSCTTAWRNGARPPYVKGVAAQGTRALAQARARRLRHAETWDGITDEEILERDGWRCQIPGCKRRPIRKDVKHPHPRSKSIDHIIPLSHGGDDTAVNKRAAHLGCNLARGNEMREEQVALFGVVREPPMVTRTHNGATIRPPKPPRLCGVCNEPLADGKCGLHLPVYSLRCDICGGWFMARNKRRKYCSKTCQPPMPAEVRDRKRKRDRERRWVDPAYRERAIAATARFHERQRAARMAEMEAVALF